MSLNKFMHPRNQYKNAKPSFLHLALKYPEFRAHTTQDDKGKVFLDFKNADALRALTTCLLKEDFGLIVHLPSDRLVPTLPLRLNYIHWLEDIVGTGDGIWGVDIGTGASCVYPLLAAKLNKWHFLATEADPENYLHATKNVAANAYQDFIHVKQVSTEDILIAPLQSFTVSSKFDFCMCNPPFFADHVEAQSLMTTRSVNRSEASSVSTASPQESIVHGGEVGFIKQMIEESAVLREKIRIYTSMVGKKSSLAQLKAELVHQKVAKFSTTEFCQGKTMRWGIAWTYDSTVIFPRSEFEARKEKPPIQFVVPKGAGGVQYNVHEVAGYIKQLLESIKVHCYQGKKAKSYTSITITAVENTWCHQRRLRRQKQREQAQQGQEGSSNQVSEPKNIHPTNEECLPQSGRSQDHNEDKEANSAPHVVSVTCDAGSRKRLAEQSNDADNKPAKHPRVDLNKPQTNECKILIDNNTTQGDVSGYYSDSNDLAKRNSENKQETVNVSSSSINNISVDSDQEAVDSSNSNRNNSSVKEGESKATISDSKEEVMNVSTSSINDVSVKDEDENKASTSDTSPKDYILKCVMRLKRADEQVHLELEWLGGQSRELMHQIFTFLKNKLTQTNK